MLLLDVVENKVACVIATIEIKTNSAPRPDGIPPKYIKMAQVVSVLTKLYNKRLKECFSDDFKLSYVIPIPKTVTPKELGNFRPIYISLLNKLSKIFEKILKVKMLNFINQNNLLTFEQFDFTTNSSSKQAITTIFDKFLNNLGCKQKTCAICLDIKKTFDTINHQILFKKLYHYGF